MKKARRAANDQPYMLEGEIADRFRISRRTLQRWRDAGGGPPFVKMGDRRVVYPVADAEKWLAGQAEQDRLLAQKPVKWWEPAATAAQLQADRGELDLRVQDAIMRELRRWHMIDQQAPMLSRRLTRTVMIQVRKAKP